MAEIDVLKAQLVKKDAASPWGFRLQGGAEYGAPLSILNIRKGSPADKIGLQSGDEVTEIGDTPTAGLTHEAANEIIKQYGLSLILTVERRAQGSIPVNPVIPPQQVRHPQQPPVKSYQPYNLTGNSPAPRQSPRTVPQNYEFHTVQAKPYDPPPGRPQHHPPPPPMQATGPPTDPYSDHTQYIPEEDKINSAAQQSRTFKILQSLMQNEEPYAGSSGLPPPRSASMERWKAEQASARRESPARVKVFMPQQYNTPIGMYTADNIVDTFQDQAEARFDDIDGHAQYPTSMSAAQQAVLEDDSRRIPASSM